MDDLDSAIDAAVTRASEPITDPSNVNWEWAVELPTGVEYVAAVAHVDREDLLFDLLYSSLCGNFEYPQRMRLLGILQVTERNNDEFIAAAKELIGLSANPQGPDTVYGGVIPGYDQDGNPVIGIIQFYFKTTIEEDVATDGNEIRSGGTDASGEAE